MGEVGAVVTVEPGVGGVQVHVPGDRTEHDEGRAGPGVGRTDDDVLEAVAVGVGESHRASRAVGVPGAFEADTVHRQVDGAAHGPVGQVGAAVVAVGVEGGGDHVVHAVAVHVAHVDQAAGVVAGGGGVGLGLGVGGQVLAAQATEAVLAVAVVVDAVVADLVTARVDLGGVVVAVVAAVAGLGPVAVGVGVEVLVDQQVTVLVVVVADLLGARMDRGLVRRAVVAHLDPALLRGTGVLVLAGVAIAVAVGVAVPAGDLDQVRPTVAVVVVAVADLLGPRVHRGVGVVAVGAVGGEPGGVQAVLEAGLRVAVAVAVGIDVPGGGGAVIGQAVAVVVLAVAVLFGARVHVQVVVVAVAALGDVPGRCLAGLEGQAVAAVAVAVEVVPPLGLHALVDPAVAVVVDAVALLGGARVDRRVQVIAVLALGDTVVVVVEDLGVGVPPGAAPEGEAEQCEGGHVSPRRCRSRPWWREPREGPGRSPRC